jgi:hypothetical protein
MMLAGPARLSAAAGAAQKHAAATSHRPSSNFPSLIVTS